MALTRIIKTIGGNGFYNYFRWGAGGGRNFSIKKGDIGAGFNVSDRNTPARAAEVPFAAEPDWTGLGLPEIPAFGLPLRQATLVVIDQGWTGIWLVFSKEADPYRPYKCSEDTWEVLEVALLMRSKNDFGLQLGGYGCVTN